jgi:hypothetical protein
MRLCCHNIHNITQDIIYQSHHWNELSYLNEYKKKAITTKVEDYKDQSGFLVMESGSTGVCISQVLFQ